MTPFKSSVVLAILLFTSLLPKQNFAQALEAGGGMSDHGLMIYGAHVAYFSSEALPRNKKLSRSQQFKPNQRRVSDPFPCVKDVGPPIPGPSYLRTTLFYEKGKLGDLRYTSLGVDVSIYYRIIQIRNFVRLNIKGGVVLSKDELSTPIETLDPSQKIVSDNFQRMKVGILGGLESEWDVLPRLVLVIGGDQRYLLNHQTVWGKSRWYGYVGLRYALNQKRNSQL